MWHHPAFPLFTVLSLNGDRPIPHYSHMDPSNKTRKAGSDTGKQRDSLLLNVILRWILKASMKEFSRLSISSTYLDDLLEISNVHALSLHYLHDHAIHVVQMGVTVAGPPRRGARRADVATRTTHTAVSRPWNTGQHTVKTRGPKTPDKCSIPTFTNKCNMECIRPVKQVSPLKCTDAVGQYSLTVMQFLCLGNETLYSSDN